jgi:hypothetical protein
MAARTDETAFDRFIQLKQLDQISIRSYYLYYATKELQSEQRESWFKFAYSLIAGAIGTATGAIGLAGYLLHLGVVGDAGVIATVIVAATAYPVYSRLRPSRDLQEESLSIRLSIHLDQILKQSVEVSMLAEIPDGGGPKDLVTHLLSDGLSVLLDSVSRVEEIRKELGDGLLKALEEIHTTSDTLESRLRLGKDTLKKYGPLGEKRADSGFRA